MGIRNKIVGGGIVLASASLLGFLGQWEGDRRVVYPDRLAGNLPTVCKGITKHTSPYPVVLGDYWSEAKCTEVESKVIGKDQLRLADCIRNQDVTQNTFDALSSHGHNFGTGATCASRAVGLINAGRIADGCNALAHKPDGSPVWSYIDSGKRDAKGRVIYKFVQGLYNRRLAERKLCLSGIS